MRPCASLPKAGPISWGRWLRSTVCQARGRRPGGHRPVTRGRLLTYALLIKRRPILCATVGLDARDLAEFQTPTRLCGAGLEQRAHHRGAERSGPAGDECPGQDSRYPSPVLACRACCWRAVVFLAGGDGVRKSPERNRSGSPIIRDWRVPMTPATAPPSEAAAIPTIRQGAVDLSLTRS